MPEPINITNKVESQKSMRVMKRLAVWAAVLVLLYILFTACTYTVGETEQVVISQFGEYKEIVVGPNNTFIDENMDLMAGKLAGVTITKGKGLHFKAPFITQVNKFDSRLLTYVSDPEVINTLEKKQYQITIYAQWRIANPGVFMATQGNQSTASVYLDNLIYPVIIQLVNSLDTDDFISNKAMLNERLSASLGDLNETVRFAGIEVEDIQIHRTILIAENLQSTYDKMVANRQKVAQQYRAEGMEEYNKAVASADKEARVIRSEAIEESERTKGEGDAEAVQIYADAYSVDSDFYTYWRSLQALEAGIDENTVLVLDRNHPLWKDMLEWIQPD
jgi:membrane protease subunit HflC